MKRSTLVLFTVLVLFTQTYAQPTVEHKFFIPENRDIEFFSGIDFNYRDILLDSQYEFLINLTPGLKWHIGKHSVISAQAIIPIVNDYGHYYKKPRINLLTASHEMCLFSKLALKPTFGLFTQERWGFDIKAMYPINQWLALESEIGYTGLLSMADGWKMSKPNRTFATAGIDVFIPNINLQFRMIGGRFLNADNGFYFEGMRHFTHCTVGLYAQYSDIAVLSDGYNGGFKIIMVIPPYKRKHSRVSFRPATNFRLTYNMNADPFSAKTYNTDPEQNERHFWFSPDIMFWGANTIYDYSNKENEDNIPQ